MSNSPVQASQYDKIIKKAKTKGGLAEQRYLNQLRVLVQ